MTDSELIAALKREVADQWQSNHDEICAPIQRGKLECPNGRNGSFVKGDGCYCPLPDLITIEDVRALFESVEYAT